MAAGLHNHSYTGVSMSVITDNKSAYEKLLLIGTGVLKAKFTTLLLAEKKQVSLGEQLFKSILPQMLAAVDEACRSVKKIYFYVILVGFDPATSSEHTLGGGKDGLSSLQKIFRENMHIYAETLTPATKRQDAAKNHFFNLLPFGDTKSCKDFFGAATAKQTEAFYADGGKKDFMKFFSGRRTEEEKGLYKHGGQGTDPSENLLAADRLRHFIFFFIRPETEEERSEQLKFAQFLSYSENFLTPANFKNNYSPNQKTAESLYFDSVGTHNGQYIRSHPHTDAGSHPQNKSSVICVAHNCDTGQLMLSDMILTVPITGNEYELSKSDVFLNSSKPSPSSREKNENYPEGAFDRQNNLEDNTPIHIEQKTTANEDVLVMPTKNPAHPSRDPSVTQNDFRDFGIASPARNTEGPFPHDVTASRENITAIPRSQKHCPLYIRVLGPVKIVGGRFNFDHSPRLSELIIYLAMHPEGINSALWSTALWPEKRVPMQTIANRLSEARRALGHAKDNKPRLRKTADRHYIADAEVDWFLFKELHVPDASLERRQKALGLVAGRPFMGLTQGYWVNLEGYQAEIEEAIVTCAIQIGRWCLEYQDPEQALWAALQALKATPFDERLYRLQMRAHDMMGNRLGIEEVLNILAAVLEIKGDPLKSVHPQTANLYRILTGKIS